jgi:CubicO group peptidase (beta-lactamase class C family)
MTVSPAAIDALVARARRDIDSGRLPAAQLAVAHEGELVVSEAFGDATTDSRFHTFSAIKPLVSLTVLELAAEGLLGLDDRVGAYLPTFAANGKAGITISHVLLHSGGFPHARLRVEAWIDRDARLATYETWESAGEPGAGYEYHPSSAHWVLADLITEVTGRHHVQVITERMLDPVGLPAMLAIETADQGDVKDLVSVGELADPDAHVMFGVDPRSEVTNENLEAFNDPGIRASGHPGGGGIARAQDVAMWYQAVLHDPSLLVPEVRDDALTTVRQRGTGGLGVATCRTHAFVLAGDDGKANHRGHGAGASPLAFGHNGAKGQVAAADPDTGVSYCYMTNGIEHDDLVSGRRAIAIATRAVACGLRRR